MGRFERKRKKGVSGKVFALVLAAALVLGAGIGGTLAWLTDKTDPITNTFTVGDINIELTETMGGANKQFKMVPGNQIAKDPKVTVKAGSEACWLFVKIDKSTNFDTYLTYEVDTSVWTKLEGVTETVYYREVAAATSDTTYSVLVDDQVSVSEDVTKAQMNELTSATYPTLTFTAYAVQKDNVGTASEAWTLATAAANP